MPSEFHVVDNIPDRYDRVCAARDRENPTFKYDVNIARLSCTCRDFTDKRLHFPRVTLDSGAEGGRMPRACDAVQVKLAALGACDTRGQRRQARRGRPIWRVPVDCTASAGT